MFPDGEIVSNNKSDCTYNNNNNIKNIDIKENSCSGNEMLLLIVKVNHLLKTILAKIKFYEVVLKIRLRMRTITLVTKLYIIIVTVGISIKMIVIILKMLRIVIKEIFTMIPKTTTIVVSMITKVLMKNPVEDITHNNTTYNR